MKWDDILQDAEQVWGLDRAPGLEPDELEELLKDAEVPMEITTPRKRQAAPPKKKRKVSKEEFEPITHVFDLVEPDFAPSKKTSSRPQGHTDDSYGDADTLQYADAADKTARQKTLRFHTSKIESASARRQGARNQAVGGDDDLPYRERRKEKEARLAKEAKNKVQHQGGTDLDDEEPQRHEKRRREEDDEGDAVDSPDEYYELVKKKSKEQKEQKKAEYEALQAAAKSVGLIVSRIAFIYLTISDPTYLRKMFLVLAHSPGLLWQTRDLHRTGPRVCGIPESRNDKSSRRRRGKFRPRKLFTAVVFPTVDDTMAKRLVYPRSSRVFVWDDQRCIIHITFRNTLQISFWSCQTFKIIRVRQPKGSKCTKATDIKFTTFPFASPFWRVEYFFLSPL